MRDNKTMLKSIDNILSIFDNVEYYESILSENDMISLIERSYHIIAESNVSVGYDAVLNQLDNVVSLLIKVKEELK